MFNTEGAAANLPTTGPFTLMADVNPTAGGHPGIIGWGSAGNWVQMRLYPGHDNGGLHLSWQANGISHAGTSEVAVDSPGLLNGGWRSVAGSWDGQTMRLFVDGQRKMSKGYSGAFNAVNKSSFCACVGEPGRIGETFKGSLRKVRIFNYALTEAELQNANSLISQ